MRKLIMTAAVCCMFLVTGLVAKAATFKGEIMDSQCAKMGSHAVMMKKEGLPDAKSCSQACVKMGGKYVLYNSATKRIYQLDDQTKAADLAGENVTVTGTLDRSTRTIHVTNIQGAS